MSRNLFALQNKALIALSLPLSVREKETECSVHTNEPWENEISVKDDLGNDLRDDISLIERVTSLRTKKCGKNMFVRAVSAPYRAIKQEMW